MNNTVKHKDAVKASNLAAKLTLLGFTVVFGTIAFSAYELRAMDEAVQLKQDEVDRLQSQIDQKRVELDRVLAQIDSASAQLVQGRTKLAEKILESTAVSTGVRPRVYVHLRSKAQVATSSRITEELRGAGFVIPGSEILVDEGPNRNELRYFKPSEKSTAQEIVEILESSFPGYIWKLTYIKGYENSTAIRPLHFELWLGPPKPL